MRKSGAVVLSCSILVGVLAVAAAAGADQTCQAGAYTVSTAGPVVSGSSTSITYVITGGTLDHAATVVGTPSNDCFTRGIVSVTGSSQATGNQSYAPAVGDPVTGLGKLACHEEAAKINPNGTKATFIVTVNGIRNPALKSVVVKKGSSVNSCAIVGIGDGGTGAPTPAPVTEIIKEPGSNCAVEFSFDRASGALLDAHVTGDSDPDCKLTKTPAANLNLEVNTPIGSCTSPPCSLGLASFGSGYIHTGSSSCTTRFIGGSLYSWGSPCP
jgi:hypothetical protein